MGDSERTRRVAETFDDWARRGRGEGMERGHRATAGAVLADLSIRPGDRFLDLGAGIAWAAREATERGADAVAVDASLDMLARVGAPAGDNAVAPVAAAFESLPFRAGSFDLAWSMEALYYAADVDAALRELHRVLTPGASLTILVDFYEENEASADWPESTGLPMQRLSEAGWREALEAAGFEAVASRRVRAAPGEARDWRVTVGSLLLEARA